MFLRAVRRKDIDPVRSLMARTVAATYGTFCPGLKAVAERDPAAILSGGARLEAGWMLWSAGTAVGLVLTEGDLVRELFVAPEAQGRGCGRLLLHVAECEIAARDMAEARLDVAVPNARARSFYAGRGWREARRRFRHPRWDFEMIEMRKALPPPDRPDPG